MSRLRYLWRALNYRWRLNRHELDLLARHVRAGDTVVDVGSHKGGFLYWLRRYVTASGRVYAFEPQPALARYLSDVARMQGWNNVTVEAAGVSSSSGMLELFVPAPEGQSSPGATLAPAGSPGPHHSITVPVVTLDAYFSGRDRRITCVKCDCEGHELEVFRGAEGVLRRDRPVLLFECEARHMRDRTPQDVFDCLRELGYRGAFFSPAGLLPIHQFRLAVHQPVRDGRFWEAADYCNNFVFIPDDRAP